MIRRRFKVEIKNSFGMFFRKYSRTPIIKSTRNTYISFFLRAIMTDMNRKQMYHRRNRKACKSRDDERTQVPNILNSLNGQEIVLRF